MTGHPHGAMFRASDHAGAVLRVTPNAAGAILDVHPANAPSARCRLEEADLSELKSWLMSPQRDLLSDAQVAAVPVGTVVRVGDGTIAARYDSTRGVVFGDERPFPWEALHAPASILWSVADQAEAERAHTGAPGPRSG